MTKTASTLHGEDGEARELDTDAVAEETLAFDHPGGDSLELADLLTGRSMARRLPSLVRRTFSLAWEVDRKAVIALLACQFVSGVSAALGLFATTAAFSVLIETAHDPSRLPAAIPAVSVLAGTAGLRALLGIAIQGLSNRLSPRICREAEYRMLEAATNAEMAAYDHPGFNDRFDAAERGVDVSRDMIGQSQNYISSLATLTAAAVVLASLYPVLLPLLLLAAIPQAVASIRGERITYLATVATHKDRRVMYMLRWHLIAKDQADQVRTDTLAPYLLKKYKASAMRVEDTSNRATWDRAKISVVGAVATGLASSVVWGAVLLLLGTGRISAASAGTAIFALRSASTGLQGLVGYGRDLLRTGLYLDDWERFVTEAAGQRLDRGEFVAPRPRHIALRDVTFRYPEADQDTLCGVDFEVRRGEIVAVVGENGSGKSTLMKLLSGLNLPTAGVVTWDGVSVADLDPLAMWRNTAVVPQDFARWPMTARENIHLGQPGKEGDEGVLAAARASGADDVIKTLRSGLSTLLAREWWGGVALSPGQWQRIAVARAAHRDAGLLVMDEPTSDLDPRAEHRIFTGLRDLASDRAVVLVTHNLANTSVADRVIVMDKGRVVQAGTFHELINQPGLMQDLWRLQQDRDAYRPGGDA
ncbi:ABC transporter ATP-binding protein [Streptomyces sp. RKAG337]|uniref:ABC transporter ATP-binding protein n=1 Tax=Streptomyces sp. RKAG337 TaxID=2893404 RepID=UPI002033C733|nr:ABC transporter ATP-binding protein [Streptomyces sp. RKAG337]MCM2431038.1 ABC transporter ATP-binding protein/permease [Streptomyces sp. RKAG337]